MPSTAQGEKHRLIAPLPSDILAVLFLLSGPSRKTPPPSPPPLFLLQAVRSKHRRPIPKATSLLVCLLGDQVFDQIVLAAFFFSRVVKVHGINPAAKDKTRKLFSESATVSDGRCFGNSVNRPTDTDRPTDRVGAPAGVVETSDVKGKARKNRRQQQQLLQEQHRKHHQEQSRRL